MQSNKAQSEFGPASIFTAGDMGLLVEFGSIYHPIINNAVMAFDAEFSISMPTGVLETVPSFRSLFIQFDPLELNFEKLEDVLIELLASRDWYAAPPPPSRRKWVLPVVYGGDYGPNLDVVADLAGLRSDQVAGDHSAMPLTVAMLGFSPGLAYLGQLPENWQFPRNTEINPKVPVGAILVAVQQTVLPGTDIPTGWRQIGQTPFRSFNPDAKVPFLLSPGDEVQFESVKEAEFIAYDMEKILRESQL